MVYLDNAATTPMISEVIDVISDGMKMFYGNPSSAHKIGREAKTKVETVRKEIAHIFNVSSSEIVFTSGGSESVNFILDNAVNELFITDFITSPLEHHAVLNKLENLKKTNNVGIHFVNITSFGEIDYNHFEKLLNTISGKKMVSLMMVNNELGTILNMEKVSSLCMKNNALFMSDTVQAIGHYHIDLKKLNIDFITASAHKFHGPKGVGFVFIKKGLNLKPLVFGAPQEHGLRAGTENIHSIMGMGKAIEIAYKEIINDTKKIEKLKSYFVELLKKEIKGIQFNANSNNLKNSAIHILNVRFPRKIDLFLFKLDLNGIFASGGSACQSGSDKGSHVLNAFLSRENLDKTSVRFSFSKLNTEDEIELAVEKIKKLV